MNTSVETVEVSSDLPSSEIMSMKSKGFKAL